MPNLTYRQGILGQYRILNATFNFPVPPLPGHRFLPFDMGSIFINIFTCKTAIPLHSQLHS